MDIGNKVKAPLGVQKN